MTAADAEPHSSARLNPFLFPSDTTFRFALLLVAVLGANLYVWNWLWIAVGSDTREVASAYLDCTNDHQAALAGAPSLDTFTAANDAFNACLREVQLPLAWWMLGGTGLLLGVAAAIMLLLPRWIVRRRRLRPLTRKEAPAVVDELAALAREAELPEEPRWLWNPLDPSPTGLAFGRPGNHSVALMGGLVTRQIADPPAFRSVVRHELAHLRNHDVDLTYATVSLWYAFLLTGVLPFVLVLADEGVNTILSLGWRLVALAGLVYLTRNAVLRAREVYADVRASVPDGPQGALRRILAGLPRRHASQWGRLRSVHPDPTKRLAAVNDTRRLFPLGPLVAFGAGVAATIAYESLVTFIGIFVNDPLTMRLLAAVAFAPLAMGVVGVGVWRGAWGALAEDRARPADLAARAGARSRIPRRPGAGARARRSARRRPHAPGVGARQRGSLDRRGRGRGGPPPRVGRRRRGGVDPGARRFRSPGAGHRRRSRGRERASGRVRGDLLHGARLAFDHRHLA